MVGIDQLLGELAFLILVVLGLSVSAIVVIVAVVYGFFAFAEIVRKIGRPGDR